MTIVLVVSFLLCWTPYTIAMFIHFLHFSTASRPIPPLLSKFLYAFAVFNSAISPYLYGFFSFNLRRELEMLYYTSRAILIPGSRPGDIPARFTSTASGGDRLTTCRRRAHNSHEKSPELSRSSAQFHSTLLQMPKSRQIRPSTNATHLAARHSQLEETLQLQQHQGDSKWDKRPGGRTLSLDDEHDNSKALLLKQKLQSTRACSSKGYKVAGSTIGIESEAMAEHRQWRKGSNIGLNVSQDTTTIGEMSPNAEGTEDTPLTSADRHFPIVTSISNSKYDDITCSLANI